MPYKIHTVVPDVVSAGSTDPITDVISSSINNNPQLESIITAGETMATHVILRSQQVACDFSSYAVAQTIDAVSLAPLCIATDNTHVGLVFYLAAIDACGDISASGHRSLTISSGAIVPRRITCDHRGDARMDVDVVVAKTSANNAIVISDANVALPDTDSGGVLYGARLWTLGTIKVANVALDDYTSVEFDLGNTVQTRGTESAIWDEYVEIRHHAPSITIRGIDPEWFKETAGIPIAGAACTHANTIIYLRKRVSGSPAFVADGVAEHIKFTAKGIATVQTAMTGQWDRFAETSLVIQCVYDGTDDPIEVDTTSAIT